jgi:hypothetical protein
LIDHGFKYVNIQENHVVTARLKWIHQIVN